MMLLKPKAFKDDGLKSSVFTFHYDAIKTEKYPAISPGSNTFTFHYDAIKTKRKNFWPIKSFEIYIPL